MLKWIGDQKGIEGIPGIPGRDLSELEVEQYGGAVKLLTTGLYVRQSEQKMQRGGSENKSAGGIVPNANIAIVGDDGPEIVYIPKGAKVIGAEGTSEEGE
jgi:hypothetical protein